MPESAPKSYDDQTPDERLAALDKTQNVLLHPDWREVYLRFASEAADVQRQMNDAPDWDTFVAARAIKLYIESHVLGLRALVEAEKADLEADKVVGDAPLLPTDYEAE